MSERCGSECVCIVEGVGVSIDDRGMRIIGERSECMCVCVYVCMCIIGEGMVYWIEWRGCE